jgi:hypothetical protein
MAEGRRPVVQVHGHKDEAGAEHVRGAGEPVTACNVKKMQGKTGELWRHAGFDLKWHAVATKGSADHVEGMSSGRRSVTASISIRSLRL